MKITTAIVIFLIASIATSFPISMSSAVQGQKEAPTSIQAYGDDAQSFAAAFQQENVVNTVNNVVIVSNATSTEMTSLRNSLKNGTILVAINLPINNPLTPVPTLQFQRNQSNYYKSNSSSTEMQLINSTLTPIETINPTYWITVIKYDTPLSISSFLAMNDTQDSKEAVISKALNAVATAQVHLPGVLPKADSSDESPVADAALLPSFDTQDWAAVAELDCTLCWNAQDFATAQHSIYEANRWNTVTNREYWLVSSYFEDQFGDYQNYWGMGMGYWGGGWGTYYYNALGPYMKQIQTQITGNIPYDQYNGLLQHAPGNTEEGGTATVGFSFGVDSGGGGSASVSYSYSWNVGQTSYSVTANPSYAYVENNEIFEDGYGFSPADATHNDHYSWQTAVFQPPEGSGFDLSDLETQWNMRNNVIYYGGGGLVYPVINDYYYTVAWNPARLYGPLDSAPSSHYVSGLAYPYTYTYQTAGVDNANNIIGSSSDWNYAHLYATSSNAMAQLYTQLNAQVSGGKIILDGYSQQNYDSHLLVYVSTDDSNWHQAADLHIEGTSHYPIECNYYSSAFSYIVVVAYDDTGSSSIYIDSLKVVS